MNATYKWLEFYRAAVLETDWSKLDELISAAEMAIRARLNEFNRDHGGTPEENQAIVDALNGLSVLRNDAARWQRTG